MSKVHTHAIGDAAQRAGQLCKCGTCGVVSRCQPDFDFYGQNGEALKCERCFRAELAKEGLKMVHVAPEQVMPPVEAPICPLGKGEAARADWKKHAARLVRAKVDLMLRLVEERLLKHKYGVKHLPEAELQKQRRRALALHEALELIKQACSKLQL